MIKRILGMILAIATMFTSAMLTNPTIVHGATLNAGDVVSVESDGNMVKYGLYYGNPIGTAMDYIVGEDGDRTYAYCIDHKKQGIAEVGKYDVTLQKYDNIIIEGMIANGFPNRNYGLTEKQAFYATKMAMVTYLEGWDIEKWWIVNTVLDNFFKDVKFIVDWCQVT